MELTLWQIVALLLGSAPIVFLAEVVLLKAVVRMLKSIPAITKAFLMNIAGFIKQ